MRTTKVEIRRGTYYDSIILMQLQLSLSQIPGVNNAGVMMGVAANKEILKQNGLLTAEAEAAFPDDLIISVECDDTTTADAALAEVDNLLSSRKSTSEQDYLPKSVEAAAQMLPNAKWALISVPGQYAAGVAREALRLQKNVFLYSDNVSIEDEIALKHEAGHSGLLLMGPDCGTSIVNNTGFGFANQVRRGPIGLVGASGTGLQQVTARIDQLGSGITHALGTGGRDLSAEVGGITALQCLGLLQRDPETQVIVLISKPPAQTVTTTLLQSARTVDKPVVVYFIGYPAVTTDENSHNIHFARSLDETAELAVQLVTAAATPSPAKNKPVRFAKDQRYLRGLFSGGTLAQESLFILQNYLPNIHSNIAHEKEQQLNDLKRSREHTLLDLGEDAFTVGRPHPMLDNNLRLARFQQEAADPEVAIILMDIVLGHGAHPDPASELAPAISAARTRAQKAKRELEIVVVLVGTEDDPQNIASQMERLRTAGARVEKSNTVACAYVGQRLQRQLQPGKLPPVDLAILQEPVAAINVGLESFASSLANQTAAVVHVDWRPPAGGNEKLMSILERMKKAQNN